MDRQQLRSGVLNDRGHLRRRQPPIHRNVDGPDQRPAEQEVEVRDAVAVQEGDTVPGCHSVSPHGLAHPTGHHVFLAPPAALVTLYQHLVVGL